MQSINTCTCISLSENVWSYLKLHVTWDFLLLSLSGQGLEREKDTDCWYSESTSATSSVDSSEYNSDDEFIDIESEDAKIASFSVSTC